MIFSGLLKPMMTPVALQILQVKRAEDKKKKWVNEGKQAEGSVQHIEQKKNEVLHSVFRFQSLQCS